MVEDKQPNAVVSLPIDREAILQAKSKIRRLTKRELEILHFIVAGESNKLIAHRIGVALRTVENHRQKIMDKTDCHSQPALTCLFMLSVRECLPNCAITKQCNHTYTDCPIELKLLKP
jgi:DNA-binding NarL/FixJ family response regulator